MGGRPCQHSACCAALTAHSSAEVGDGGGWGVRGWGGSGGAATRTRTVPCPRVFFLSSLPLPPPWAQSQSNVCSSFPPPALQEVLWRLEQVLGHTATGVRMSDGTTWVKQPGYHWRLGKHMAEKLYPGGGWEP